MPQSNNITEKNIKEFCIYPTVFKNNVTISCSENTKVKIVDAKSQTINVYEINSGSHNINTFKYPNGIYFVTCQTPDTKKTYTLFKPF